MEVVEQVLDALLVFGFVFVSTLGGIQFIAGDTSIPAAVVAASIPAGIKFFAYLIQVRGIDVPDSGDNT